MAKVKRQSDPNAVHLSPSQIDTLCHILRRCLEKRIQITDVAIGKEDLYIEYSELSNKDGLHKIIKRR